LLVEADRGTFKRLILTSAFAGGGAGAKAGSAYEGLEISGKQAAIECAFWVAEKG